MNVEIASLQVWGEWEVVEVSEAPGDALGHLEEAVDGLDGGVGEPGFEVREDAGQMALVGARELAEGFESRERSAQPSHHFSVGRSPPSSASRRPSARPRTG